MESQIRYTGTYLQSRLTERTDVQSPRERRAAGREVWDSQGQPLPVIWTLHQVLARSYTQHPAINHSGKGYFKKNVCMCIPESLCCTANSGLEFFLDFIYLKCMLSFSHTQTPGSEGHRGKKELEYSISINLPYFILHKMFHDINTNHTTIIMITEKLKKKTLIFCICYQHSLFTY